MQLVAFTAAALFAATSWADASPDVLSSALSLLQSLNDKCNINNPMIKIVNTCSYPVHLWSISKGDVCSPPGTVIQPGSYYQENYRPAVDKTAVSIKLSKTEVCDTTQVEITQVEYMIETSGSKRQGVLGNFHDVSFVNCNTQGNCPGRDGFYLKTGNVNGQFMSSDDNQHCPILNCDSKADCASMAYVNPDDVQTKWCQAQANMEFHICGQNGTASLPSSGGGQAAAPSSAASAAAPSKAPSAPSKAASSAAAAYAAPASSAAKAPAQAQAQAQAYTPAPVVTPSPASTGNVRTEYVYSTVVVEVEQKRDHLRRHAHRHQHFHA